MEKEKENSKIYFVTKNMHKFSEVSLMFQNENVEFDLLHSDLDTIEIQANLCRDVALSKLTSIREKLNYSFFIEDSGFYVDTPLNGFPGVYSSYVYKTIGNEGILKLIDDFRNTEAHFVAVIALYYKPTNKIFIFEGKVKGRVSDKIRGEQGFGFDPIFIPYESSNSKTFGELTMEEKSKYSHRGKALKQFIPLLKTIHNL